jgi:hypothetical protein
MPNGRNYRLIAAILREMDRRKLTASTLTNRMRRQGFKSWTAEQLVLRLGELVPGEAGGRHPLCNAEIMQIAAGLNMPTADLLAAVGNG